MDPALSISSPFHNAMEGKEGVFDGAIDTINHSSPQIFTPKEKVDAEHSYFTMELGEGYGSPSALSSLHPDSLEKGFHYLSQEHLSSLHSTPRSNGFGSSNPTGDTNHHNHSITTTDKRGGNSAKSSKKLSSHSSFKGHKAVRCAVCDQNTTISRVPSDGHYICLSCYSRSKERERPPRHYPTLTFKCCPTATTELEGGVVQCAGCQGWYHQRCVGIKSDEGLLSEYVALSTTKWYCPEDSCSGTVLAKQVKQLVR